MPEIDIKATIKASTRLAIQLNPRPYITHKLRVVEKLKLADDTRPEGFDEGQWTALLDHFDSDDSVALQRGVFYLPGDIAEVDRFEAAALLTFLPDFFEPTDAHSQALLDAIRGEGGAE